MQQRWDILDLSLLKTPKEKRIAHRLNALGSLYYFCKVILRRHRLYDPLHEYMASLVESEHLKLVIEIPRDHFKSTIYSEAAPMWWALPFRDEEEAYMRALGYGDEFIRWMKWAHNEDTRTVIISENKENVNKIGLRFDSHYQNNDLFRWIFSDIIPDTSCIWSVTTKEHKRRVKSPNGEGTYDVLSVGSALQSRHYTRAVEDDLVGRDAIDSDKVMSNTINYHRLLPGAFDGDPRLKYTDNDEIVVGNRWALNDLNSWIRNNNTGFRFVTHSALGGCCPMHPTDQVIFPLEWTKEKLLNLIPRFGLQYFSCQYLNNPVTESTRFFNVERIRYYTLEACGKEDRRAKIVHEVRQGEIVKDIMPVDLAIQMIIDPNHGGNSGRCRHAITVTGVQRTPLRIYLLDCWAESCTYEKLVNKIYELANYWRLNRVWLETVAAQKFLKFYLDYRNKVENRRLNIVPLKTDNNANAKGRRIESFGPYIAEGQFWMRRSAHLDAYKEFGNYIGMSSGKPISGHTVDIIDTLGYAPEVWNGNVSTKNELIGFLQHQRQNNPFDNANIAGY